MCAPLPTARAPHPAQVQARGQLTAATDRCTLGPDPQHDGPLVLGPALAAEVVAGGQRPAGQPRDINAAFSEHGRWTDGLTGFVAVPTGSLRTDGCAGAFDAMPMSGGATQDDPDNYARWTFHTGGVTRGICNVDVYTPGDTNVEHVGGHPAYYQVFASTHASGVPAGSFLID